MRVLLSFLLTTLCAPAFCLKEGRTLDDSQETIAALILDLCSPNAWERMKAAAGLGLIGPAAKNASLALVEALSDTDSEVRKWAARSLAQVESRSSETIAALGKAVLDSDERVAFASAEALMEIGTHERSAIATLVEALKKREDISAIAAFFGTEDLHPDVAAVIDDRARSDPRIQAARNSCPYFDRKPHRLASENRRRLHPKDTPTPTPPQKRTAPRVFP